MVEVEKSSPYRESLIKVLSTMKIAQENKVLIAIKLQTDNQIITFLKWLKTEVPENKVQEMEEKIVFKAVEINKIFQ